MSYQSYNNLIESIKNNRGDLVKKILNNEDYSDFQHIIIPLSSHYLDFENFKIVFSFFPEDSHCETLSETINNSKVLKKYDILCFFV